MAYFDGGIHGWNGPNGYVAPAPQTKLFCDPCAEEEVPLRPKTGVLDQDIGRHWDTGFKWAPIYGGGSVCQACGKAC